MTADERAEILAKFDGWIDAHTKKEDCPAGRQKAFLIKVRTALREDALERAAKVAKEHCTGRGSDTDTASECIAAAKMTADERAAKLADDAVGWWVCSPLAQGQIAYAIRAAESDALERSAGVAEEFSAFGIDIAAEIRKLKETP